MHGGPTAKGERQLFSPGKVRMGQVDGAWVPMECKMRTRHQWPNGDWWVETTRHKRTEVVLDPDFEALKAFAPGDIRNSAMVFFIHGDPSVYYTWQDGKVVNPRRLLKDGGPEWVGR